jgi:O-antigen/teichoic acid export membrane protein
MTEEPITLPGTTLRNAGSSLVQMIVATLSLFVLYRVVLDIIGTRQFGIWSLVVAATSMVGLSNMGLTGSIVKHVADSRAAGEPHRLAGLIETTLISVGLLSVLLAVAGFPAMKLYFRLTLTGDAYRLAVAILPVALVAFCLSMITAIYQSALYGCHLIVQRNGILIFESLAFLALSVGLAPRYGLFGLVYARAAQNLITLILSAFILKRHVPLLATIPLRWNKGLFKDMIGYALSFQFISLLSMVMDPLSKGLLSRFGSLEMVAYFEMGTRLVGQVRGVVVNANQVLVPTFAQVSRTDAPQVAALFRRSYAIIFYLSVCLFGFLTAALPLLGLLWLGAEQPTFVNITTILSLG